MRQRPFPVLRDGAGAIVQFAGGRNGVLLLHGFTGTPAEMKYLGGRLLSEGYSVYAPRYPGHGTNIYEMAATSSRDWITAAREALIGLRSFCDEVSCVGLSMGGIIGILLAAEYRFKRLALLSTPCALRERSIYLAPVIGRFKKILWQQDETMGINSTEARAHHICYSEGKPVLQAWQLHTMIKKAMALLPRVTSDLLIMQSLRDEVIPLASIDRIYNAAGSREKEKIYLEISNHTITVDYEKDHVAEEVSRFLASGCRRM